MNTDKNLEWGESYLAEFLENDGSFNFSLVLGKKHEDHYVLRFSGNQTEDSWVCGLETGGSNDYGRSPSSSDSDNNNLHQVLFDSVNDYVQSIIAKREEHTSINSLKLIEILAELHNVYNFGGNARETLSCFFDLPVNFLDTFLAVHEESLEYVIDNLITPDTDPRLSSFLTNALNEMLLEQQTEENQYANAFH